MSALHVILIPTWILANHKNTLNQCSKNKNNDGSVSDDLHRSKTTGK